MKNGVCLKCGVNAFLRIYQRTDEDFYLFCYERQPDCQILEYQNMVIIISLSVRFMCCRPIPPPLSEHSQSNTRWQWLGYGLCLGYMGEIERACAMPSHKRFHVTSESKTSEASRNFCNNKKRPAADAAS